jgi:hypothetical protein
MLELRRDDLQLFLIHYSIFVLLYIGNIEFKMDSKFLIQKWLQTPLQKKIPDSTCSTTCLPNFVKSKPKLENINKSIFCAYSFLTDYRTSVSILYHDSLVLTTTC